MNKQASIFLKLGIILFITVVMALSSASAWAALTKTEVSQLYVAIFGRASEGEGNSYWQTIGLDMAATANVMLKTDAAKDYFGANLNSNQAFIEHIYLNTLNKTLAEDSNGIAYWVGLLNGGSTRGHVSALIVEVIKDYAPDGPYYNSADTATVIAYNWFANRVMVSDYMADTVLQAPDDWAMSTKLGINGLNVTNDSASVSEAKNFILKFVVDWKYLVEAKELQSIPAFVIRNAGILFGQQQFNDYFKHNIKVVRLVYKTEYKGHEINASGLLCYPVSNEKSYPLLVIENGLLIADHQAPSAFSFPDNFFGFEFFSSAGYFVLIPDLLGLGASQEILFQMYNAKYAASATIDMMKAAEEYIASNQLPLNDQIFLSGYSMGGFVACASLKAIEEQEFRNITATAIGGGGYNLVELMEQTFVGETMPLPGQLALLFASYNSTYEWNKPLTDFFDQNYASIIPELINGDYEMEEINEQLTYNIDDLLNPIFLNRLRSGEETELMAALSENSVYDWAPRSLLRLYHSKSDERIPFSDSWNTYQAMMSAGSNTVDFVELFGEDHFNAVFDFMASTLPWFESLKYSNSHSNYN